MQSVHIMKVLVSRNIFIHQLAKFGLKSENKSEPAVFVGVSGSMLIIFKDIYHHLKPP